MTKIKLKLSRIVAAAISPNYPKFPDKIVVEQEPSESHVAGDYLLVPDQEVEVIVDDGGTALERILKANVIEHRTGGKEAGIQGRTLTPVRCLDLLCLMRFGGRADLFRHSDSPPSSAGNTRTASRPYSKVLAFRPRVQRASSGSPRG